MNEDELRRDFAPFADPATELVVNSGADWARVEMVRDGQGLRFDVNLSTGHVRTPGPPEKAYASLGSLFASESFANLRQFASHQQRILASKINGESVIEAEYEVEGEVVSRAEVLDRIRSSSSSCRTRVIVIDGPAGIGKTYFLERLALEEAQAFIRGELSAPVLHVSSRGSRLSNLRDVIAKTTQLFRARFRFEEVPVLVRHGLILLAIDGFDELVDADGYKDAWFSLREFLDEIGGAGTLMLSGRDTFFDQQGFYNRLDLAHARLDVMQVRIRPVKPSTAREWLLKNGWLESDVFSSFTDDVFRYDSYVLRPYFLTQICQLGGWSSLAAVTLRRQLVDRFVAREADLLMSMIPSLGEQAALRALEEIYGDVALDMVERQADTVDIEYLSLLCEVAFERVLASEDLRKLTHKVGSIGLLERDLSDRLRRFPHQELLHYFLSQSLVEEVREGRVPSALRHSILGTDFLEVFNEEIQHEPVEIVEDFLGRLSRTLEREVVGDRLPSNGAALVLTALSRALPGKKTIVLEDLDASDACLLDAAPTAVLNRITVGRLDGRGADFSSVVFKSCYVGALSADGATRFGVDLPAVGMVRESEGGSVTVLRAPDEVQSWLEKRSTLSAFGERSLEDADLPLMKLLDRVCRRVIRHFAIREDSDDEGSLLLRDPLWPELQNLLGEAERIEYYNRPMGGSAGALVRVKNPRGLLSPLHTDKASIALRQQILDRARELIGSAR